jgi:hypothetical protein
MVTGKVVQGAGNNGAEGVLPFYLDAGYVYVFCL